MNRLNPSFAGARRVLAILTTGLYLTACGTTTTDTGTGSDTTAATDVTDTTVGTDATATDTGPATLHGDAGVKPREPVKLTTAVPRKLADLAPGAIRAISFHSQAARAARKSGFVPAQP